MQLSLALAAYLGGGNRRLVGHGRYFRRHGAAAPAGSGGGAAVAPGEHGSFR